MGIIAGVRTSGATLCAAWKGGAREALAMAGNKENGKNSTNQRGENQTCLVIVFFREEKKGRGWALVDERETTTVNESQTSCVGGLLNEQSVLPSAPDPLPVSFQACTCIP